IQNIRQQYSIDMIENYRRTTIVNDAVRFTFIYSSFIFQINEDLSSLRHFVHEACLTALLTTLDAQFSMVTVPTDANTFHKCYTLFIEFMLNWTKQNNDNNLENATSLLKMCLTKFNTAVYYRLRQHELHTMTDEHFSTERPYDAIISPNLDNKKRKFH